MLHFLHLRNSALLHSENIAFHVANLQKHLFTTSYKRDKKHNKKRERSDDTNVARTVHIVFNVCEEEETRTPTSQLTLPPQSSASTNSATSPVRLFFTTLVGRDGFEPPKPQSNRFTVCPFQPLTYLPLRCDIAFFLSRGHLVLQMRVQRYNFFCNLQTF